MSERPVQVMSRGFRDKCAPLYVTAITGATAKVYGTNPESVIGWPIADLYVFDDELFKLLMEASEQQDRVAHWKTATRIDPSNIC